MRAVRSPLSTSSFVFALALGTALACSDPGAPAVERCETTSDCSAGRDCVDGRCTEPLLDATSDLGDADALADTSLPDLTAPDTLADTSLPDLTEPDTADACDACSDDELCCAGRCVDPSTSVTNCGACGASCLGAPEVAAVSCVDAVCRIDACALGFLDCDGLAQTGCERAQSEADCTGCGESCGERSACVDGACTCTADSCPCPGGGELGDAQNCMGCGLACGPDQLCQGGRCTCPEGGVLADDDNCTACGQACGAEERCAGGTCVCQSGVLGDDANCGACGVACDASEVCASGHCVCPSGAMGDDRNCGACGLECPTGTSCAILADGVTWACGCGSGLIFCGGACIDPETSAQHCGACNVACPAGTSCRFGTCAIDCPANRADCDNTFANGCERTLDSDGSCGTQCGTVRDCGGFGDTCVTAAGGGFTCRCDNGRTCRPGETCVGISDRCECSEGTSCGPNEVCCASGGQRLCIDLETNARHCGACNRPCDPGLSCVAGNCQ